MNEHLHLGPQGTLLCHHYEQLRLRAYPDPGSELARALREDKYISPVMDGTPWTIGWGDTGDDVHEGLEITAREADERFARRMAKEFEPAVRAAVKVPLNQLQFDALVSLTYTCGCAAIGSSTLIKLLNRRKFAAAAAQFPRWNKSGGQVLRGLVRRREAERLLFLGEDAGRAIAAALRLYP